MKDNINTAVDTMNYEKHMCAVHVPSCSGVSDSAVSWPAARQASLWEWEWVAMPSSRESNAGIETRFPALQADSLLSEPPGKPMKVTQCITIRDSEFSQ